MEMRGSAQSTVAELQICAEERWILEFVDSAQSMNSICSHPRGCRGT